jgi:N-acetylglucosamine kinase-like BadF-type ATPase
MPLVVGIDAGGTSTAAVVARDREIVGTAAGEGANLRVRGVDAAANVIAKIAEGALQGAQPQALFVGAAGGGNETVARDLQNALAKHFKDAAIGVSDDARIALRAAFPDGDGAVVIAGTGSIVYAEVDEKSCRGGGYGYLLGDEGSGYAIGNAAARLLLRTYDGRSPREPLVERIEEQLGARDVQSVIARVYESETPVRVLAGLAPLVFEAAERGERSATRILQTAALELFELLKATLRRCNAADRRLRVAFAGGLLSNNSLLSYLLETRVMNEMPDLELVKGIPAPEYGALVLARTLLGRP